MPRADWNSVFDDIVAAPGATTGEIERLAREVRRPLDPAEIEAVNKQQPEGYSRFDPSHWRLPDRPLPPSYLGFLRWSARATRRGSK